MHEELPGLVGEIFRGGRSAGALLPQRSGNADPLPAHHREHFADDGDSGRADEDHATELSASNQAAELVDTKTCFADNSTQRALRQFFVIRNSQSSVRRLRVAKDHVAARLMIDFISRPAKSRNCFSAR
jgi:hypothetical protein